MDHQPAQEIIAYCGNCNKSLTHTITAVDDSGKVLGVSCEACKEEHPFNQPIDPEAPPKKSPKKKAQPKKTKQISDDWKTAMERVGDLASTVYTMGGDYLEGEKIEHRSFGMGLIQKLIAPDKMEVLFESGQKLLVRGCSHSV